MIGCSAASRTKACVTVMKARDVTNSHFGHGDDVYSEKNPRIRVFDSSDLIRQTSSEHFPDVLELAAPPRPKTWWT